MNIEEVSETDIEEIKGLARRVILESVDASDETKVDIIADTLLHIDKNSPGLECVFLKCIDPDIQGFILVQNYWNLSDLFVLPESRGKGVGKLLFTVAKSVCLAKQERGYIRVNSSLNAEGFYRNLGFESFAPLNEVPNFVAPLIYNF